MTPLLLLTEGGLVHASSRTRALGYEPMFKDAGFDVSHVPARPDTHGLRRMVGKRWNTLRRVQALVSARGLVYAQRLTLAPAMLGWLRARGIPLVYDFDDALFLGRREESVAAMVRQAQQVIVSTPALVPFVAQHQRPGAAPVVVLPTPIEADRITPAHVPPETFTLGWIGSPWTTPYLAPLAPVLVRLAQERTFRLKLVGADPSQLPPLPGVAVDVAPWCLDTETDDLRSMTVGIMPLPDDAWAAGKGAYKLYQYMAAGLPVVASPVGLNAEVVRRGDNGLLASTADEWHAALQQLMDDPALVSRLGASGRRDAETRYDRRIVGTALVDVLRRVAC